jgi:hypothetical protein
MSNTVAHVVSNLLPPAARGPSAQSEGSRARWALVPALALAGCHGSVEGTVVIDPHVETVLELEPNDQAFTAQGIGPLAAGECLAIHGSVNPFDVDGFAFVADQDLEVRVVLAGHSAFADLDLCVYDPFLDSYPLCLLSPDGYESGAFTVAAGAEFHLVVTSAAGSAGYELSVETFPVYFGFAAQAAERAAPIVALTASAEPAAIDAERSARLDGYRLRREKAAESEEEEEEEEPMPLNRFVGFWPGRVPGLGI